jgi:hypothetical protein
VAPATNPLNFLLRLSSALPCLLLVGCEPLWNAANRSALESDIRAILKPAGVVPQQLECRMVGATRDGSCSVSLTRAETASAIRALALESMPSSADVPSPLARLAARAGPSCAAGEPTSLATYGLSGRPKSLRLPSGSAFEYLLLTINKSTGQACLQVSYAYG